MVVHDSHGAYWDLITEFDVHERQDREGKFFFELCQPRRYFSLRQELWEIKCDGGYFSFWAHEAMVEVAVLCRGYRERSKSV